MTRLLAALALLTRIPVRRAFDGRDVGRASVFYPLIGAGIGGLQLALWHVAGQRLPSLVGAVLLVAFSAWLTRGLHLDGVADFVDGLGGGASREEALRIMRDSRIGAFGAMALILVLAAKIAALDALGNAIYPAVVLAPALSRWSLVVLSFTMPYARKDGGLTSAVTDHVRWLELVGASVLSIGLVCATSARLGLGMWGGVALVSVVVALIARSRLGGVTGDVLGANVELAEAAALVAALGASTGSSGA